MESQCTKRPTTTHDTPRIYVASLSDYNAGHLHGCWIEANQPVEDIREEIARMLAQSSESPAEEWAIHDYENFGSLRLSEFEDIVRVAEVASLMSVHGPLFAELVSHFGDTSNVDEARRYMEEAYRGAFDSLAEYAQDLVEDCYADILKSLPDFIRYHIDYECVGLDIELAGDIFTVAFDGKVHIFDALI